MSFNQFDLAPPLLAGIEAVGYTTPTPIQQQAIPHALQGGDVLGLAQTGTGKTAAFILPILQRLMSNPAPKRVRALVVAPTRELAEQIHQVATVLGKNTNVRSVTVYGGVSKVPQLAGLRRGAEIVIACPGRLLDHINEGAIKLNNIEVLVLDEADTMCNMGFLPDIRRILSHLPAERQTLFFSATMPPDIRKLSMDILDNPSVVEIDRMAPVKTVSHALYPVPESLKKQLLLAMLEQTPTGRALIFTRTKHRARTLARDLEKSKYRVSALRGNLSQNRRQEAMDGFRDGKYDLMVATDIAAHGIDVPEVSHVINFDMPDTVDAYTHRIGRTGRALQTGEAFTIAVAADAPMVRDVERALDAKIERRRLPDFDYGGFMPENQFPEGRQGQTRLPPQNRNSGQRSSGPASPRSSTRPSRSPAAGARMGLGAGAARPSRSPNNGSDAGVGAGASRGTNNEATSAPGARPARSASGGPGASTPRTTRGPNNGTGPGAARPGRGAGTGTGASRPARGPGSGAGTGARTPRGPNGGAGAGPGTGAARPASGASGDGRLGTRPGSSNGAARPPGKRRAGAANGGQQLGRRSEERSNRQSGTQLGKRAAPKPTQRTGSGAPRGGRPATNR